MTEYVTIEGDLLDEIAWRHYGQGPGFVELVLSANPGLAQQPIVLPAGLKITLPDPPAPADTVDRLWS